MYCFTVVLHDLWGLQYSLLPTWFLSLGGGVRTHSGELMGPRGKPTTIIAVSGHGNQTAL